MLWKVHKIMSSCSFIIVNPWILFYHVISAERVWCKWNSFEARQPALSSLYNICINTRLLKQECFLSLNIWDIYKYALWAKVGIKVKQSRRRNVVLWEDSEFFHSLCYRYEFECPWCFSQTITILVTYSFAGKNHY